MIIYTLAPSRDADVSLIMLMLKLKTAFCQLVIRGP